MATYIVTRVRKELSADGTHRHIEGVFTDADVHYTRLEVVDSIWAGNVWKTQADGYEAVIEAVPYCPQGICLADAHTSGRTPTAPRRTTWRTSISAEGDARSFESRHDRDLDEHPVHQVGAHGRADGARPLEVALVHAVELGEVVERP